MGVENMGYIFFAQAFLAYFTVITDFGFNYTSTREVSLNRTDSSRLSEIFSETMNAKILLTIMAFVLFILIATQIPKLNQDFDLYLYSFPIVIGQAFLPFWLFQGLEKMKFITLINFISKLLFLLAVVFLLKSSEQYLWVNFALGLSNVLASIAILVYASRQLKLKYNLTSPIDLWKRLKTDSFLFYSMLSSAILTNSNIVILGFFASPLLVGQFGIAEKIFITLKQILGLFSMGIYPRVCILIEESRLSLISFLRKTYAYFNLLVILMCIVLIPLTPTLIELFSGNFEPDINNLFYILIPGLLIITLNIAPNQTIMAMNKHKPYSLVFILSAILNIIINIILVNLFGAAGTALSIVLTESILTIGLFAILSRYWKSLEIFNIFVPKKLDF